MERTIKISLGKAKEWYNSGNKSLKELALQAFKKEELMVNSWKSIKTFEDACKILDINPEIISLIYDTHLQNICKLQIIRKALNGIDWEPKLNAGTIYYPWLRYYLKETFYDNKKGEPIADFKAKENNKVYILIGGDSDFSENGLGTFSFGYGIIDIYTGLLGCKSQEIAKYFSKTFGKLIFDAIYSQYNNYTWI